MFQKTLLFATNLTLNSEISNTNDYFKENIRFKEKTLSILEQSQKPFSLINTDKYIEKIIGQIMNLVESRTTEESKIEFCINSIYHLSNRFSKRKKNFGDSSNILNLLSYILVGKNSMSSFNIQDFYRYL